MYRKPAREFSRKDQFEPQPRRGAYRGQYVRRTTPSGGNAPHYRAGSFSDDRYDSSPPPAPLNSNTNINNHTSNHHHQQPQHRGLVNSEPIPYAPSQYQQQQQSNLPPRMQRGRGQIRGRSSYDPNPQQASQQPLQDDLSYHQSQEQLQQQPAPQSQQVGGARRGRAPRNYHRNHDQQQLGAGDEYTNNNNAKQQELQQLLAPPHQQHREAGGKKVEELARSLQRHKTELTEMMTVVGKLSVELELVKTRLKELELKGSSAAPAGAANNNRAPAGEDQQAAIERENRRKEKKLKQREKKALKMAERRAQISENASQQPSDVHPTEGDTQQILNNTDQLDGSAEASDKPGQDVNGKQVDGDEPGALEQAAGQQAGTSTNNNKQPYNRHKKIRLPKRDFKDKVNKPLPKVNKSTNVNDDSTTQAAEPSSEDRLEGEDGRDGTGKERIKIRRKKQYMGRRGAYSNRRRRADSSERNSNDTSPQGEGNASDKEKSEEQQQQQQQQQQQPPQPQEEQPTGEVKTFAELDEAQLNEAVQTLKREFLNSERPVEAIKDTMNTKGPKVVYEFAVSILDHAICDVTSPTKLTEIATSLYQLIVVDSGSSEVNFTQGFYDAVKDISKREEDIAIDAPRYMDTLGQLLADCVVPMWENQKETVKPFLENVLESYCEQNRPSLLESITKGLASAKSDEFAKEVMVAAELNK